MRPFVPTPPQLPFLFWCVCRRLNCVYYFFRSSRKPRLSPPSVKFVRVFNKTSVADPGCLSRILIFTHPGSRIPDPKTVTKERWKKIWNAFFVVTNFTTLNIMLFLKVEMKFWKKFGPIFKKLLKILPKNCQYALNYMGLGSGIQDPGSGKNLSRIQGS